MAEAPLRKRLSITISAHTHRRLRSESARRRRPMSRMVVAELEAFFARLPPAHGEGQADARP